MLTKLDIQTFEELIKRDKLTNREKITLNDLVARHRLGNELTKKKYAPCCGAPEEPYATNLYRESHVNGLCFGDRAPCRWAKDCANLVRRLRYRNWPTLVDCREPYRRVNVNHKENINYKLEVR